MHLTERYLRALLLLLLSATSCAHGLFQATLVQGIVDDKPTGVTLLYQGSPYQAFDRPLPVMVDPSVLVDFQDSFNHTQDFYADGSNTFQEHGQPFVASIPGGRVTGVMGAVYDKEGRFYAEMGAALSGIPEDIAHLGSTQCKQHKRLATGIQKYGHMYYHFLQEVLPRLLLLKPYLDKETKLLMFGAAYEAGWLDLLGIPREIVEIYDPTQTYCADELIVPSPSGIITSNKEGYLRLRDAVGASEPLPEEERNLVIYCSRKGASERQMSNEDELISALRASFPSEEIVVFTGAGMLPAQAVDLFKRARVVFGLHGAGLSHSIFSAPGTTVMELLFMADPPMMFWHMAGALGHRYEMLPLPQSWWLQERVEVPEQDLIDAMALALNSKDTSGCSSGHAMADEKCAPCPSGSYRFSGGSTQCLPCGAGRVAPFEGSSSCQICPKGSISVDAVDCVACAEHESTLFPGSMYAEDCLTAADVESEFDAMFNKRTLARKLVAVPALEQKAHAVEHGLRRSFFFRRALAQDLGAIRDTQLQMLNDLFQAGPSANSQTLDSYSDVLEGGRGLLSEQQPVEEESEAGQEILSYGGRTVMSYRGRRLSGYGVRQLSSYGFRRLSNYGERSSSSYGVRSLSGYGGRRLLAYGGQSLYGSASRSLLSYGSSGYGRRLRSAGRRLSIYRRRMSQYGRRLSQYARRLVGYGARLPSSAGMRQQSSMATVSASFARRLKSFFGNL